MKHCYYIDEPTELFVANNKEQAVWVYQEQIGVEYDGLMVVPECVITPDDRQIDSTEPDWIGKTYAEVAAMYDEPQQIASSY